MQPSCFLTTKANRCYRIQAIGVRSLRTLQAAPELLVYHELKQPNATGLLVLCLGSNMLYYVNRNKYEKTPEVNALIDESKN